MSPWHGLKLHHGIGKAAQTSQVGAAGEAQEARERRWRERGERRTALERTGRRRYRPGPGAGETFYSPGMLGTSLRSRPPSIWHLFPEREAYR